MCEEMTSKKGDIFIDLAQYHITNRSAYEDPEMLTLDYIPGGGNKLDMDPYSVEIRSGSFVQTRGITGMESIVTFILDKPDAILTDDVRGS